MAHVLATGCTVKEPYTKSNKRDGRQLSSWHGGDFSLKGCCSMTKAMHLCSECEHTHAHIKIKAESCGTAVFSKPATTRQYRPSGSTSLRWSSRQKPASWNGDTRIIQNVAYWNNHARFHTSLLGKIIVLLWRTKSALPSNTDMLCLSSKIPQWVSRTAKLISSSCD